MPYSGLRTNRPLEAIPGSPLILEMVFKFKGRFQMPNIQDRYKKRKRISISLLVLLFCCLIALGIIAPRGAHPATRLELILFGAALLSGIASRFVLRCPSCGVFLMASWRWPKFCSKCGEKLVE